MVGPGYSYAVITSSTDATEDPPGRRCSGAGERRCSRDHGHANERRHSRDCCHEHHHDHYHDRYHDHNREHPRHGRSREPTRSGTDPRRSREHTLSGSSNRDSSEAVRPRFDTMRSATGPFASLASGLTRPKRTLAKSALEMSDVEGGTGSKSTRPTTVSRKSTMRSRGNTHSSMRRKSGSLASTSSLAAIPPMSIRKKSREPSTGQTRMRGLTTRTPGTVDLKAGTVNGVQDKAKSRRRGSKAGGGLWGGCFGW